MDHPCLVQLADYLDGRLDDAQHSLVSEHLEACLSCRVALRHAGEPIDLPQADTRLASSAVLDLALARTDEPPPEPAAGQLWRLRWDDVVALAVVLRVHDEEVTIAPVGIDSWLADEYAVYVSEAWSPIGVSFAVWMSLVGTIPLCVLDWYLGDVDVLDQLPAVSDAFRKGIAAPAHIPVGAPIDHLLDERWQYRRQMMGSLSALADAAWCEPLSAVGDGDLGAMLDGCEPSEIGSSLGLEPPDVFVLLRGDTPLTAGQAELLSSMSGRSVGDLLNAAPPVPPALLRELDHPVNRPLIEGFADRNGWSPVRVRFEARNALLGRAARFAGDPSAPIDWRRVLRDWLEE